MAAAKWQQANDVTKCENGRPKMVRNRQPKSAKTSEKVQKRSKKSERAKKCKMIGVFFVDRFSAIFQWPYSGGHLAAIGDTIAAIGPYSAIASRGQLELRYPLMLPLFDWPCPEMEGYSVIPCDCRKT